MKKKFLMILVGEGDRHGDLPLYEAVIRKLVQLGASGATVQAGIMGFGSHHQIHTKRLFGISDDRPISIAVIEDEAKIREVLLPAVRPMLSEGLVFMVDAEVL